MLLSIVKLKFSTVEDCIIIFMFFDKAKNIIKSRTKYDFIEILIEKQRA